MNLSGDFDPVRRTKAARGISVAARRAFAVTLAAGLAGCSAGDSPGALLVDPGRYSAYHCNDLATRKKELATREKELRELIERANQGAGGAVIGSLAYRPEYESVLSEEKLLQRTAAEKNCNAMQQFQSDQIIR